MTGWFEGRVAVVSGAGHGIGAACARRLAAEGAAVGLIDVDESPVAGVARSFRHAGARAVAVACDVRDTASVDAAVDTIRDRFGPVDLVVANAGVVHSAPVATETDEAFARLLDVNVAGVFRLVRAAIEDLRAGRGSVVITASMSAFLGEPGLFAYCASKGALVSMARQLATEYAADGVRVNAVCPGWVDTGFGMQGVTRAEIDSAVVGQVPLGRQGDPAEIASAVAFLLSADASYVTGHALLVDGGVTAALRSQP